MKDSPMQIVLVGNPNVGKSAIFGDLTGLYVNVSNYPGTTVEIARSHTTLGGVRVDIVDTPGINSLNPLSDEERVTHAIFFHPHTTGVLQVADAKNLRRALLLSLQIAETGIPYVLDLNMEDETAERGILIDHKKLARLLGVPVVKTVATRKWGMEELKRAIISLGEKKRPSPQRIFSSDLEGLWKKVDEIMAQIFHKGAPLDGNFLHRLGEAAMHPVWGIGLLVVVMYFFYLFVGKFGAQISVDWMENTIFGRYVNPLAVSFFSKVFHFSPFLRDLFVGPYGVVTMALTYALAIIFPIVVTFFFAFSLLEDSGYLPRLAVMLNHIFKGMGLNGKAVVPMVLGLGCDTMATMSARTLDTKKERIILTLLLALGIPCSAQLGIILAMLSHLPLWSTWLWLATVIISLLFVGFLAARVIPGPSSLFLMEIPPLRRPLFFNIFVKTAGRLEWYLKEVVPLFILGTLVLFFLDRLHWLTRIEVFASPLVTRWLDLPPQATEAFLIGFLRRDYGATHFFDLFTKGQMDAIQTTVSLIVMTLFVPCLANLLMIFKERGWKTACAIAAFIYSFAFAVGGVVNFFLR